MSSFLLPDLGIALGSSVGLLLLNLQPVLSGQTHLPISFTVDIRWHMVSIYAGNTQVLEPEKMIFPEK